jgi:hypothetical protein
MGIIASIICFGLAVRLLCMLMGFDEYHKCYADRLTTHKAARNGCAGEYYYENDDLERLEKKCLSCPYFCIFPKGE